MTALRCLVATSTVVFLFVGISDCRADDPSVDLSGYRPESGIVVRRDGDRLTLEWPMDGERGQCLLDLRPGRPLFASMGVIAND